MADRTCTHRTCFADITCSLGYLDKAYCERYAGPPDTTVTAIDLRGLSAARAEREFLFWLERMPRGFFVMNYEWSR